MINHCSVVDESTWCYQRIKNLYLSCIHWNEKEFCIYRFPIQKRDTRNFVMKTEPLNLLLIYWIISKFAFCKLENLNERDNKMKNVHRIFGTPFHNHCLEN